jgi:hypothetical protein
MATVTPVKFDNNAKPRGVFKVARFNMFEDGEAGIDGYADFRNQMADATKGIVHEHTREYSRKTVVCDSEGGSTTTEEIILVVQYWEKPVKRHKGESSDDHESKYLPQPDQDR